MFEKVSDGVNLHALDAEHKAAPSFPGLSLPVLLRHRLPH